MYVWGLNNDGQLGNKCMIEYEPQLVEVFRKKKIVNIYAGMDFSVALLLSGRCEIHITGNNAFGQLGVGRSIKNWFGF